MVTNLARTATPRGLPEQPPAWVRQYIGIPFSDRGRARDSGVDCWGLVRLVYAERFGVLLPSYVERYLSTADQHGIAGIFEKAAGDSGPWSPVSPDQVRTGDLAAFRVGLYERHVGMVVDGQRMLHCHAGVDSCLERLDAPLWRPRLSRFLSYTGPVRLRGLQEPLCGPRVDMTLPAGLTVEEMLRAAGVAASEYLSVYVGDVLVPREKWALVRPRAGRTLTVAAVPRGGSTGKTAARIVLTIAVIVAAVYLGPVLAGPAFLGYTGATAGIVAAGITAGITIAGTLAVNALIPPSKSRLTDNGGDNATTSPALTGSRNTARQRQVMPTPMGTYRYAPPYGALPYTEVAGSDQYLRCLFDVGQGPVAIEQIRIGTTPIGEYDGVELEVRNGFPDEPPITLYPGSVEEVPESQLVSHAAGWIQRTSGANADEISVDLTFPQGLLTLGDDGTKYDGVVRFQVEYSPAGANAWRQVNSASPSMFRELDYLMRTPEVVKLGEGTHAARIAWSGDGSFPDLKPAALPWQGYTWVAGGYLYCPTSGVYTFGLDGSDACDVHVDGRPAASWYGGHLTQGSAGVPSYAGHTGQLYLEAGWHSFRARVESRLGTANGGAIAVAWQRPGDAALDVIPAASFLDLSGVAGQLTTAWFDHSGYASDITVTARDSRVIRRTVAWAVPRGKYDVRVQRVTQDFDQQNILDDLYLTAVRTIRASDPLPKPGRAKIAVRIKATDQLNGVLDELNCLVTSILPDYDAAQFGTWVRRPTRNPASIYRAILQGPSNKRPLPDNRIHLADLAQWHTECAAKGFEFNGVLDFSGTVRERLADVAAAGRASPGMRDGLHSVIRDVLQTTPVQHFTPRNSSGFQGVKVFPDLPHGLICKFPNAGADYQQDERVVLDDGYQLGGLDAFGNARPDLPEATNFESFEMFGVTSAEQVFKLARYHIAVARLRPETFTISTDFEHLACSRGDLVLLTHDVMLVGLASGRVTARVTNGAGELVGLVLDQEIVMEAGKDYRVRVRLASGVSFPRPLVTTPGASQQVTFTSPVAAADAWPAVGDLFAYGESGRESIECLVRSIEPTRDLTATLTLVSAAPGVHVADSGEIPPFDSGITTQVSYSNTPEDPVIESIRSDDSVMIRDPDGSLRARMVIQLRRPSGTRPIPVAAQVRTKVLGSVASWEYHPVVPLEGGTVSVDNVDEGITYDIRLRVITAIGATSGWVAATHTVIGKSLPPPDVQSLEVIRLADGTRQYSWVLGTVPPDIAGVRIRYGLVGAPWENLTPLHSEIVQATPWESTDPPAGTWRFGIKMLDTAGNESVNAAFVERTLGAPPVDGVAFMDDAQLAGWPGTQFQCHRAESGNVLEADDNATWGTLSAYGVTRWDQWLRWVISPKSPISYEHVALDAGFVLDFSPDAIVTADGDTTTDAAWSADGITYTNWQDIRQARGRTVSARYLKIRTYVQASAAYPVPVLRTFVAVMRAPTIVQDLQDINTSGLPAQWRYGVGDIRIPIAAGSFRVVRTVGVSFNGLGPGWSWELIDRDAAQGPRVKLYNAAHELADALIDATVRGL